MISDISITAEDKPSHPLKEEYEKRLSSLIGMISNFIITKNFNGYVKTGRGELNKERADEMVDSIIEESSVLIGPVRSEMLRSELKQINNDFFMEGKGDER